MILFIILLLIAVIAGFRSRLLTTSGAIAAFFTGVLVYLGLGLNGLLILGLFFVSSSMWSKVKSKKKQRAEEILVKGSQRDWQQVLANGGLAALSSALYYISSDPLWMLGFCITIAAANSDTWASEVGSMSKSRPYYIRTLKRAERGTSGAVSPLGTFASIVGSFLIAYTAFFLFQLQVYELLLITILGYIGNVIDTLLGAFIQAQYQCPTCGLKTERRLHCGKNTTLIKGSSFFDNDVVNFMSGFISLLIGIFILKI
jgi:uncharacterized protein (TIGR00297 family)